VTALDCFDDFYPGKEANLTVANRNPKFKLIRGDIRDENVLLDAMKGAKVVFHLAAQAGVKYCIENPVKAHEVNVTGTLNVLNAARKNGVKKLVYASSSSIYGNPTKVPLSEDMAPNPTSIYGATKLAAEKYCTAMGQTWGLPVTCLRYFSAYGPRGRPDQVVTAFALKVMKGERPAIYGDGSYSRDFTFISDVVSATVISAIVEESNGQVINIGYGKETNIASVARMVLRYFRSELQIEYRPGYAGDFPRTLCDNSKARRILSWRPQMDFAHGIEEHLKWLEGTQRSSTSAQSLISR
jgi:UDP-glucose 4-epimerase